MNKKPLIIAADEDKDLRFLIRMYLRDYIFEVAEVRTDEDFRTASKEKSPVAIFLNFMMGETPGLELAEEGFSAGIDCPVIIMALEGFDLFEDESGVSDYLIKPFTKEQFIGALEKALGKEKMQSYLKANNPPTPLASSKPSTTEVDSVKDHKVSLDSSEKKKIIVADDDASILTLLKLILKDYDVDTVSSGDELVDKASSGEYDLIISDVIMPKMSGWKALKALRDKNINVPVIFSSGLVKDEELYETLKPSGVSMFILKPFKRDEILSAVSAFLKLSA
ncbi:MAG: response regulator [Elusimicrobia bacterium]|nr:response regulator [Elusimicrobiota bacterium]